MAEQVTVTNWPTNSTADDIAFKLWQSLGNSDESVEARLQFFAKCRRAARGLGEYAASAKG